MPHIRTSTTRGVPARAASANHAALAAVETLTGEPAGTLTNPRDFGGGRAPTRSARREQASEMPFAAASSVVRAMLNGQDPVAAMRSASPFPFEAQRFIDRAVTEVALDRLTIVNDLLALGLTFPLDNWLGIMQLYKEKLGRAGNAKRAMIPGAAGENQWQSRTGSSIPIYVTFDDFGFNIRELAVGARAGAPLDVSGAKQATRNVNESIEDQGINGISTLIGGFDAPGFLNAPDHNTYSFVGNHGWTNALHTGADCITDVLAMQQTALSDNYYGPYRFYAPKAYTSVLGSDFKSFGTITILQRLLEIDGVQAFKIADKLPDDAVLMFQPTEDVVDVVVGQQPVSVTYQDLAGFNTTSIIMAVVIVRPHSTFEQQSGIVVGKPS